MFEMKFNMTTPEGREAHTHALNGSRYHSVLVEFDEWLRQQSKYNNNVHAQGFREKLFEMLRDEGIEHLWD